MTEPKPKRRPRGASPRGNFEEAKQIALSIIQEIKESERKKTDALRQARHSQSIDSSS